MDYYINIPQDFDIETFMEILDICGINDFEASLGIYKIKNLLNTEFNYKFTNLNIEKYISVIRKFANPSYELPVIIFTTGKEEAESIFSTSNNEDVNSSSVNIYYYDNGCSFTLNINSNNIDDGNSGYIYSLLKQQIEKINNSGYILDYITIVDPTAKVYDHS